MRVKWRLFRQDAGREAGPPAWAYVALFALCIVLGNWSLAVYQTVGAWPANGVLLAAVLQLHQRKVLPVFAVCFVINLVSNYLRQDVPVMLVVNAVLNFGEAFLAGALARRFCGAALDMRRPVRLIRFALLVVAPVVSLSALIGIGAKQVPPNEVVESLFNWVCVEGLGLLIVTPPLLLLARNHRFRSLNRAPNWEKAALMALLVAVSCAVFAQAAAPVLFLVFLPLLLIAFRLSPPWAALAVIVVAVIANVFSFSGLGPMTLSKLGPEVWAKKQQLPVLRILPVLHMFLAAVVAVALPASTVLTERRRLEARLRARTEAAIRARALAEGAAEAKSRFLSMMSHEMRTPLNGVAGFAELLVARPELDEAARREAAQIRRASDGLLMLVDDILDYSRGVEDLTLAPFSPAAVAEEAVERLRAVAETKGLALTLSGDLDPNVRMEGDARRVRQVLGHLLSNAVKFTARGAVVVRLALQPSGLKITVADTGPGLDPTALPGLFEAFVQADASIRRDHEGAGMGLALCRRLTDLMGGEIAGANGPEGGAEFIVHLPLARLADAAPVHEAAAEDQGRPPRVLVVDDHPMNREVASLMLTAFGCEVAIACDGIEAVEAVSAQTFDLVLMDVRMPRMDGLEAARAIRALPGPAASTPIVAVTADAMPEDVARCHAAGMGGHLAKPVSRADLLATLNAVLGGEDETAATPTSEAAA